ncbi:MAG: hypothetical protein NVS3B8_07050 [Chitinophagaceae bacterium]
MSKPLVSVLVTSYNRENYIAKSIESVLGSTYENFEVIVVDDCSADKTYDIILEFVKKDKRVRGYQNDRNLGQFHNRNYIATLASGEYLKYLDSDDCIYPYGIEIMMYHAMRYPDAGLLISSPELHDTAPFPIELSPQEMYTRFYLAGRFPSVGPSAMLIKTSSFNSVDGFSIPSFVGSDTEFILKLAAKFPVIETEPGVIWYRVHEGQEMTKGIKSHEYIIHEYPVYSKLLLAPGCPLAGAANVMAIKKLRKQNARFILRYLLRTDFRVVHLLYRQLNPTLSELFSAFFK